MGNELLKEAETDKEAIAKLGGDGQNTAIPAKLERIDPNNEMDEDTKNISELKPVELPKDKITSNALYDDPNFESFNLGASTWNPNHITSKDLNQEEKTNIKERVESRVNLEEYEVQLDYIEGQQVVKED